MSQQLMLSPEQNRLVLYNHLTYLLYVVGIFTSGGLLWIVPIIMNYLFRSGAKGTWIESHFAWQINTFWGSLIPVVIGWSIIFIGGGAALVALFSGEFAQAVGWSLLFLIAGSLVLLIGFVWNIYRIVRGWIALADKRSIP